MMLLLGEDERGKRVDLIRAERSSLIGGISVDIVPDGGPRYGQ